MRDERHSPHERLPGRIPPPSTRGGIYQNLFVFGLSFSVSMALVRPEPPPPPTISAKLVSLERRPDVDLVFVGSSKTHFNFMPSAFDAEVRRLGSSVTSFNLGVLGAGGHEVDYILDHFLPHPPQLKVVFIEFPTFEYQTIDPDELTYHKIYWHDARRTIDAVHTSLIGPMPVGLRIGEVEDHLLHFALRFCGLWPSQFAEISVSGHDGFEPWDHPSRAPGAARPNLAFLRNDEYVVSPHVIRRQQARLKQRGVRVFYVIPPGTRNLSPLIEMARAGEIQLFKLNDPRDYPELYRPDTNSGYLLPEGARLYSQILAVKFVEAAGSTLAAEVAGTAGTLDGAPRGLIRSN